MYYCKKCGYVNYHIQSEEIEICECCKSIMFIVPEKYLFRGTVITDEDEELLMNELVKTSSDFDQYLYEHKNEILAERSAEFNAKMDLAKTLSQKYNNIHKCPSCGSTNISKIGTVSRMISTGIFGLASSKIGKTHKCNNCGTTW